MFNNLGQGLGWLGERASIDASRLGHKLGGALISISPVVSLFNLVIGSGVASSGLVLKAVGAVGDDEKALMTRGVFNPQAIRRTIDGIRNNSTTKRLLSTGYSAVRMATGNLLERGR